MIKDKYITTRKESYTHNTYLKYVAESPCGRS